mmetsp:Transcript_19907/g.55333  ORF Transcript_19907/g.55333 Transcript_19907/m.55333 type:complete len:215 (+) Transcript_19907:427-1071(+)
MKEGANERIHVRTRTTLLLFWRRGHGHRGAGLVLQSLQQLESGVLHLVDSVLQIQLGEELTLLIHEVLQPHDGEEGADDGRLPQHTRVQDLHLRAEVLLAGAAVEDVGDGGDANSEQDLEWVGLDVVGALVVPVHLRDDADAGLDDGMAVEIAEPCALFVVVLEFLATGLAVGPCDGLQGVLSLVCELFHAVLQLLLAGESEDEEGWHDGHGSA